MRNGGARLIVVVAAVVIGILILTKGLSSPSVAGPPDNGKTTGPAVTSPGPTTTNSTSTTGPDGSGPEPQQKGVAIAIYNATTTNGLAGAAETDLKKKGYVVVTTGNFPQSVGSTIYYRDGAQGKADAQLLKQDAIPEAAVKKLPANLPADTPIPKEAELVVVLGNDYAAAHPITG